MPYTARFGFIACCKASVLLLAAALWALPIRAAEGPGAALAAGIAQCDQGSYSLAVTTLGAVHRQATGAERVQAAGALGLAYLRMRQPELARPLLREAWNGATDPSQRARYGLDLANLEARQRRNADAQALYDAVLRLAPADLNIQLSVALNRVPLAPEAGRLALLEQVHAQIGPLQPALDRAAFLLNLGLQAQALGREPRARRLAHLAFVDALATARPIGDARLIAAAQSQLAQLYEDEQRVDEALRLSTQAIQSAQAPEARDLLIAIEWRRGRLLAAQRNLPAAIAAYQRAIDQIEAVRQDIPVEYANGRSSFRDTLEPLYLGLADLLLQQASQLDADARARQFLRVRDTLERIKQTELEDFLGNRCSLEGSRRATRQTAVASRIAPGSAVLYPVILPDRLELLIETASGIERRTVSVTADSLRQDATAYAAALRARRPFMDQSRRLYDALLAPVAGILERQAVDTIVVVPDGVLRLVPFGALHDGQRFVIEQFAISVVPAVTMPDAETRPRPRRPVSLLLAGVSEPGAVVEKLPDSITAALLAEGAGQNAPGASDTRAMVGSGPVRNLAATELAAVPGKGNHAPAASSAPSDKRARNRLLQNRLALSGVVDEINAIAGLAPSTTLLNGGFSVQSFSDQVASGAYGVVHIASHGVFGRTAADTFVMAHDDLITIDQLQSLLRGPAMRQQPIDLLTLSACETAEGDDRAPLGLSGAALKAQAHSALGSLWPVSDAAATLLMGSFYRNLVQAGMQGTAKALQDAQVRMIAQPVLQHPYFWAPFILVERRL